jgi:adsorption protein B
VRQKTRWLHGIAYQGWERLGWGGSAVELWMRLRDRRGPLIAVVLAAGYLLFAIAPITWLAEWAGLWSPPPVDPVLRQLIAFNFMALLWRLAARIGFTTREYGWREGVRAVLRMPLANVVAIMAGRRALVAYLRALRSGLVRWDHTAHFGHPTLAVQS